MCIWFGGFVDKFSDRTAITLIAVAPVAYLVHVLPVNSSAVNRHWLVENRLTLGGIFPAKTDTYKESELSGRSRGK